METDTTESKTTGLAAGLENLIGARRESNGVVIFNPKEWPKFMVIVLALLVGYYLFNIILGLADFNNYDFIFFFQTERLLLILVTLPFFINYAFINRTYSLFAGILFII